MEESIRSVSQGECHRRFALSPAGNRMEYYRNVSSHQSSKKRQPKIQAESRKPTTSKSANSSNAYGRRTGRNSPAE